MDSKARTGAGFWAVFLLFAVVDAAAAGDVSDAAGLEFFEKQVRPVLAEHCFKCHSTSEKSRGGLLLDSRAALLKGGDNGPVLVPGRPDKSRLVAAIRYEDVDLRMPPRGKLPAAAVSVLETWVKMGAPWPREDVPQPVVQNGFDLQKRKRAHWAWQPVRPQQPPAVKARDWPRGAADRFLLAKMEDRGLTPAPPADPRTLLRRVYFDLVGLPPPPAAVEAFAADSSDGAFAKVVDRLLASQHFGERWGRHWLDLVRYGESRGHEFDPNIANAYQYRDYIIRAFNADVPYNQLVTEHLAGDLLAKPRLNPAEGFNESVLGTGFWFLGEEVHSPVDIRQDEADRFDNRIDVMSKTFLGLTVACARCHDHKFDAISTKDYYALFGFLESSSYRLARFDSMLHNRPIAGELWKLRERSRPAIQKAVAEGLRPGVERLADTLLAAREVILAGAELPAVARSCKLDAGRLERWVTQLRAALRDDTDPFHAWARVAADAGAREPKRLAEVLKPLADAWSKRQAAAAVALKGAEVVVDYGKAGQAEWMPDGVVFGPGPVRPGDVRLGTTPGQPIAKVYDQAAAEKDPTWNVLRPSPGAENDPGALGGTVRAGRTIRTPTFTITTGKVFYLVKGTGQAYAAVSQHVMIAGPLHAQLVLPLRTGDRFQWVGQDLSRYKGLRVHVEFSAVDDADFAVAMVVQGTNVPGSLERPSAALLGLLRGEAARSPESLAAGYQGLLLDTMSKLATDRLVGSIDHARLVNWVLRHRELFVDAADRRLAEAAAPFLAEQAKWVGRIKANSRLAPAVLDGNGQDAFVFNRGNSRTPGALVPRRLLEALAGTKPLPARGSGRLELARQMTDPTVNPFIARVMVNRLWHHLFGRGLVASVDNFGVLGEAPTHPELLDFLADRFVEEGWSVKKLIRELVLSSAYRMSSHPQGKAEEADAQNLLLHRMRVRRLEGEAIRDAMLTVSGRLDEKLYGPSVPVALTPFQDGRGRPASGPLNGNGRRSLYLAVRRNFLSSFLLAFDTPIPFSTVGRRTVSNVPAQALILMNDPFVHLQAGLWAKRVVAQGGTTEERISGMYLSAYGRPPSATEKRSCLDFLDRQAQLAGGIGSRREVAAWADLAHMLFNVKEFIFLR